MPASQLETAVIAVGLEDLAAALKGAPGGQAWPSSGLGASG